MSSTDNWLPEERALAALMTQANATAKQLGHEPRLPWDLWRSPDRDKFCWWTRCVKCSEQGYVRHRTFSEAPLSGVMLTFRCARR